MNETSSEAACIYRDKIFVLAADGYVHAIE